MIRGIHGMFYSSKADELRTFLRDKLQLGFSDVGGGWLIFDLPEGDLGVHPTEDEGFSGTHDISFYTDDLRATVAELQGRGVSFDGEIAERGYGSVIDLTLPGGVKVQLYQPRYTKRVTAPAKPAARKASAPKRPAPRKKVAKAKVAAKKGRPAAKRASRKKK